jgi:hypothetical protein
MTHLLSKEDHDFHSRVESCNFPASAFNHQAHLRLAYIYLSEHPTETAYQMMRNTLLNFLECHGLDKSKYHETMTRAWMMAVRHFMKNTPDSESSASFMDKNPMLLDTKIMLTHYSAEVLFSNEARATFLGPNLDPIPSYIE